MLSFDGQCRQWSASLRQLVLEYHTVLLTGYPLLAQLLENQLLIHDYSERKSIETLWMYYTCKHNVHVHTTNNHRHTWYDRLIIIAGHNYLTITKLLVGLSLPHVQYTQTYVFIIFQLLRIDPLMIINGAIILHYSYTLPTSTGEVTHRVHTNITKTLREESRGEESQCVCVYRFTLYLYDKGFPPYSWTESNYRAVFGRI